MKKLVLDLFGIKKYQQNREPYLMIDYATEVMRKALRENGF